MSDWESGLAGLTVGEPAFGTRRQLTRQELYDLVWQTPMSRLAKRFGLSDVGLKKVCRKHDIPTPPLGYWAKRTNGKRVHQPQLPAAKGPQTVLLTVVPLAAQRPEIEEAQAAALERIAAHPPVAVPAERPAKLHPVAARTSKALRATKAGEDGLKHVRLPGAVEVAASHASVDRVERIIDAFARAAEERGYSVAEHPEGVQIVVGGMPIIWRLKETMDQKPHEPTQAELKAQVRHEANRARYPGSYSSDSKLTVYRAYDQIPSGRLSMTLRDPTASSWNRQDLIGHWCDRRNKTLEDYLDQAMAALATGAVAIRHRHAEEAERKRREQERFERRRREQAKRERAQKRSEFLLEKADVYQRYGKLSALAEFLERDADAGSDEPVDHLVRELREKVDGMRRGLERDSLREEIARLQLYADDDIGSDGEWG